MKGWEEDGKKREEDALSNVGTTNEPYIPIRVSWFLLWNSLVDRPAKREEAGKGGSDERDCSPIYLLVFPHSSERRWSGVARDSNEKKKKKKDHFGHNPDFHARIIVNSKEV